MSSDTAPAAVPAPATPPASPAGVQPGGMAGLLSAVEPARPAAFHITPTADGATVDGSAEGASSDAFGDLADTPQNASGKSSSSGKDTGIIRAYLLAGAERWRKGADARLKQLDIKKAKAQAFKESRKVNETRTVNRAEKIASGPSNSSTGSGGGAGKSLSSKNSSGGAGRSNSGGGRGGSSGRGSSGHGSGGRGTTKHDRSHSGHGGTGGGRGSSGSSGDGSRRTPNGSDHRGHDGGKGPGPKGGSGHSGGGSPRSGHDSPRKQRPTRSDEVSTDTHSKGGRPDRGNSTTNNGGGSHRNLSPASGSRHPLKVHSPGSSSGKPWRNTPRTDTAAGPQQPVNRHDNDKSGPYKPDLKKTGPNGSRTAPKPAGPNAPKNTGKRINTGESRETGYRDGSRVATAIAHGQAYRDGYKDGYRDTKDLAAKQKARLDRAHDDRKKQRQQPPIPPKPIHPPKPTAAPQHVTPPAPDPRAILMNPKEKPVPSTASGDGATPVKVDSVDARNLHLADGAARQHIGRGEVRRLKDFERSLTTKADTMIRISDAAKVFGERDKERTKAITYLMEQARAVDGGDSLVAELHRLQQAATARETKAAELYRRSMRAADGTNTVLGNVETRYAGMYQAVVDSPLTKPAESAYYRK